MQMEQSAWATASLHSLCNSPVMRHKLRVRRGANEADHVEPALHAPGGRVSGLPLLRHLHKAPVQPDVLRVVAPVPVLLRARVQVQLVEVLEVQQLGGEPLVRLDLRSSTIEANRWLGSQHHPSTATPPVQTSHDPERLR